MKMEWPEGDIDVVSARMTILEHKVTHLHAENKKKSEQILSIEEELKKTVASASDWEKVLNGGKKTETQINILNAVGNEIREQNKKQNNLIIYGLPTSSTATNFKAENSKRVIELFAEMGIHGIERDIVHLFRFKPRRWSYAPPPVRLVLNPDFNRLWSNNEILRAAKRLKDSKKFKNVGISNDLSYPQQKLMKKLIKTRSELNSKLNGTEAYRYCIRDFALVKIAI